MDRSFSAALLAGVASLVACGPPPADPRDIDADAFARPDERGPYAVVESAPPPGAFGTLYLPSTDGAEADSENGPHPLLVVIPGFASVHTDLADTSRHLASHGFAVLGADHGFGFHSALSCGTQRNGRDQVATGIDALVDAANGGSLSGVVDARAVGVAGHSYGGKLAYWLALEDTRVEAVFGIDPVDGGDERGDLAWCPERADGFPRIAPLLSDLDKPAAAIGAGRAGECAPDDGDSFVWMAGLPPGNLHFYLPEAAHTDFVDAAGPDCGVACSLCPESGTDARTVQAFTRSALTAFFKVHVVGDARFSDWVTEPLDDSAGLEPDFFELLPSGA